MWCAIVHMVINLKLPMRVGIFSVGDVLSVSRFLLLDV